MTYVVRRPGSRWEVRESVMTPRGPRARSLASFRVLSPTVLERAAHAASRAFDRDQVLAAARRVGAPVEESASDRLARDLLAELAAGRPPPAGLRRLLLDGLARAGPVPEAEGAEGLADWIGASPDDRGRALRELLDLGDRLPSSRRGPLRFPRLTNVARG